MMGNRTKKALQEGKVIVGTMITEFASPEMPRLLGASGFDFAIVDTEHSPFSLETTINLVRSAKSSNLTLLARVPTTEYHHVAKMLDVGVQGVMIPHVEQESDVRKVINSAKYPPIGARSYGVRPVITDYEQSSVKEQISLLNDMSMILIQIESEEAVKNVENLVSNDNVDGVIIGPNDLSISLGVPGDLEHPSMQEAIEKVIKACKKFGKGVGTHTRSIDTTIKWLEKGMNILLYSTDASILLSACTDVVRVLREHTENL